MFDKRQYLINTVTNYVVYFSNIAVALVLSPFIVRTLGDTYYGIWTIIVAFTGYYGFLDMGIRQGVSQYISRYLSSREYDKFNVTINAALIMLSLIGVVVLAVSYLFSIFFCDSLPGQFAENPAMKMAVFILGAGVAVKFPFLLFQTVITGMHRYEVSGSIAFLTKILYGIAVYLVLLNGYGILGLAVATTSSQLIEGVLMMVAARRLVPQISISFCRPDRTSVKEVMSYGIFNFITGVSQQTVLFIGPMVIASSAGPELVAYYSIGANLIPYYGSLVGILSIPLLQVIIAKDVKQENEDLKLLYLNGTRYVNLLVTYIAFGLLIVGEPFLGRWMGHKYVDNPVCSSYVVMSILALSQMVDLSQTIGRQVLFGVRRHKFLAVVSACGALFTTCATVLLVQRYSAVGAAVALLLQSLLINGLLMPLYMCRLLKVTLFEYLKSCVLTNLILFLLMTSVVYRFTAGRIAEDWLHITAALILASAAYLLLGGFLILGKDAVARVLVKLKAKATA